MRRSILILFFSLSACAWFPQSAALALDDSTAIESASTFLALLDRGDISAAFETTTAFHRSYWQRDRWVDSIGTLRSFYGPLINRAASKTVHKDSYPKHPDGEYIVIVFESSFSRKRQTTEIVAVTPDGDGRWRVSDYICN